MEGEQARMSSLNNSVYVRGFPSGSATEEALVKIFSQFGPVKKVYIDSAKGVYAIVEFLDENCAFAALTQSNNLHLNDKRLVVKPREIREPSIKTKSGPKKKLIDTGKPSTSKNPLKAPRSKISVSNASDNNPDQGFSHNQDRYPMLTDNLLMKLGCANSVDDKIKIFHQETRPSVDAVAQAISICNLVEQACSLVVPNCKAVPYGSLISEFGSYKSDLDICILSECTREDEDFISGGYLNIGGVPYSFNNVKTRPSPDGAADDIDLQLLAHTISMHVPGALRVRHIKIAKCPVIKFYYSPANKECDVTINNRLALCNSLLLKKYSQFDNRLAPLVSIVCAMIRSSGINGRIFSSYSISLMVIYALQHCSPPILPCLQDIGDWPLTTATASELTVPYSQVDGWSFSFHPIENMQPSSNQLSLGALLNHFVSFYSTTFDFKSTAVSIHTPATLDIKSAIEASKTNSSNSTWVFKVGPACIQDPIELSHNVSQNLMVPPFTNLLQKFSSVSDLLQILFSSETVGSKSGDSNVDFLQLFRTTKPSIKKTHLYAIDINSEQVSVINKLVPGQLLFENQTVKSVIAILEKELAFECTCISEDEEMQSVTSNDAVIDKATDAIIAPPTEPKPDIQRRGVKRSLYDPELVMAAAKRPRMQDSISSVDSNVSEGELQISLQYQCKSLSNTWTNRRKMRRKATGMENSIIPVDYSHEPIEFTVTVLTNIFSDDEIAARVLLVPTQSCDIKNFQVFFAFFKKHLLHYSTETLLIDENTVMDDDEVPSSHDDSMQ